MVLGGDEPLAFPMIESLQQCGYIVVASVRTPEAAEELERTSEGYLRAIVLNPSDVCVLKERIHALGSFFYSCRPFQLSCAPSQPQCPVDSQSRHQEILTARLTHSSTFTP